MSHYQKRTFVVFVMTLIVFGLLLLWLWLFNRKQSTIDVSGLNVSPIPSFETSLIYTSATQIVQTPTMLIATSLVTATAMAVYPISPYEMIDGPPWLRGANSMWRIGGLAPSDTHGTCEVYLMSRPPLIPRTTGIDRTDTMKRERATLATSIYCDGGIEAVEAAYSWIWEVPEAVGNITITSVVLEAMQDTGLNGLVKFTTTTGRVGTFDLQSQVWQVSP